MAVIDATVGGASSNSYATIAEADAYFVGRYVSGEGWAGYTEAQKTARLIHAARIIDRLKYIGVPTDNTTQIMQWPRKADSPTSFDMWAQSNRLKVKNMWIETDEIPDEIKWAQIEIALVVFDSSGIVAGSGNRTSDGAVISSETLGRWTIKYGNSEGSMFDLVSNEALNFLVQYLDDSLTLFRES
jgi:hypothetical protein